MRLLLDEHLDSRVAVELRRRGHDVVAVTELLDVAGREDRDLLAWARDAGRVLVTYDVRGFAPLVAEHQVREEPLAGVIFLSSKRYPQGRQGHGPLVRDLASVLEANDDLTGRARWLDSD